MTAATIIVHELLHSCGGKDHKDDDTLEHPQWASGEGVAPFCNNETGMLHSSFMILMAQRYSCIGDSPCCAIIDDSDWMAGEGYGGFDRNLC